MRRIALAGVFAVSSLAAPFAQDSPPAAATRFEVASVRPFKHEGLSLQQFLDLCAPETPNVGMRYYRPCTTVRELVLFAYDVPLSRLRGNPLWTLTDFFRIEARASAPVGVGDMRLLVRQLLVDRFALQSHTETVEDRFYRLLLANPGGGLGPNAKPSAVDCTGSADAGSITTAQEKPKAAGRCNTSTIGRRNGLATRTWTGVTMAQFAASLPLGGAVVVDETGIDGVFDLSVSYLTSDQAPRGVRASNGDWQGAVEQQLGLKLESTQGPVDILVIDSVQQPTEN